jgi:hypothetical protein
VDAWIVRTSARFFHRLLLVGAVTCLSLWGAWLLLPLLGGATPAFAEWGVAGTPLGIFIGGVIGNNAVFLGLMLLAQWAFLRPVRRIALHGTAAPRPRWHAVVAVAFVATLLCTAMVATLLELPNWWVPVLHANDRFCPPPWNVLLAMLGVWAVWSGVFFVYFRQGDFLAKAEGVVRTLIRGSCLELLIAIPTHAFVYRRGSHDCYCERGSYTGLVFGAAVLLWAFGPGLVLLFWREKQRREPVLQRLCPQCGAILDPATTPESPCPHCGRTQVR